MRCTNWEIEKNVDIFSDCKIMRYLLQTFKLRKNNPNKKPLDYLL